MTNILMPALSPTMEEGKLAKWHVKEGDEVKAGDILAEIETDKATMEFEAVDEGTISKILVPEGTEGVKVNHPIAVMNGEGEAAVPAATPAPVAEVKAPEPAPEKKANGAAAPETIVPGDPDLPEGTEFVTITVRDALRDAMAPFS
jgi:pyruvate dehydrogenase E1 component beta subunit